MKVTLTLLTIFLLFGCGGPLKSVTYAPKSPIVVSQSIPMSVNFTTGKVTGSSSTTAVYAGGAYIPVNTGPTPKLHFGITDQEIFIESLKSELLRHGVAKSIVMKSDASTLNLMINFLKTEHDPSTQEYKITATLNMDHEGNLVEKKYSVGSLDGENILSKLNNNAASGKSKVASKLMSKIMTDILEFSNER